MLLSTLLLTVSSFSQTGIQNNGVVDLENSVILTEFQAKQVIVDLLKGDKAQEQVDSLSHIVSIQNDLIIKSDSLSITLNRSLAISDELLRNAQEQIETDRLLQERLQGTIRKNRAYAIGFGCTTAVAVSVLILNLIRGK